LRSFRLFISTRGSNRPTKRVHPSKKCFSGRGLFKSSAYAQGLCINEYPVEKCDIGHNWRNEKTIEKALKENYRVESVFSLKQALEIFDIYQLKIQECDQEINKLLTQFEDRRESKKRSPEVQSKKCGRKKSGQGLFNFNLQQELTRMAGVDITEMPGIDTGTGLKIISEIGLDMPRWKTTKNFVSWLGLCPNNQVSGGNVSRVGQSQHLIEQPLP
jgi:hypothetical protein